MCALTCVLLPTFFFCFCLPRRSFCGRGRSNFCFSKRTRVIPNKFCCDGTERSSQQGGKELSAGRRKQRPQLHSEMILIELIIDPHVRTVQQRNGLSGLTEPAERDLDPCDRTSMQSMWCTWEVRVTRRRKKLTLVCCSSGSSSPCLWVHKEQTRCDSLLWF